MPWGRTFKRELQANRAYAAAAGSNGSSCTDSGDKVEGRKLYQHIKTKVCGGFKFREFIYKIGCCPKLYGIGGYRKIGSKHQFWIATQNVHGNTLHYRQVQVGGRRISGVEPANGNKKIGLVAPS